MGLWAGASWVGVWVELALGARFNTKYFRFGPCLLRFCEVSGVPVVGSQVNDLLQDLRSLVTKTVAPDTVLVRERLRLLWFCVDIPPVSFTRIWVTIEDANGSRAVHMEVRPHLSWLLFLLTPVIWAVLGLATNPAPNVALFLAALAVFFGTLFWLQLRATKNHGGQLWERVVRLLR